MLSLFLASSSAAFTISVKFLLFCLSLSICRIQGSLAMASCSSCYQHLGGFATTRRRNGAEVTRIVGVQAMALGPRMVVCAENLQILKSQKTPIRRRRRFDVVSASALATHQLEEERTEKSESTVILEVRGLKAVVADTRQEILSGVDLIIREGEVHAIMGKNGSGKSTLSKVLVGHPDYEVTEGTAVFKGENLFEKEPEERSHLGLFLSFQSPVEIPGVSNMDFLRMACNARRKARNLEELGPLEFYGFVAEKLGALNMDPKFLDRNVNEGFSGGEKKRNEILQLSVLEADMAILDEIDSGLDIDALRDVASAVIGLRKDHNAVLMITHYQRLLDYIKPTFVHIMEAGRIVKTGDMSLASQLEAGGYNAVKIDS